MRYYKYFCWSTYQPYLEFDAILYGRVTADSTAQPLARVGVTSNLLTSGSLTNANGYYLMPHRAGKFEVTAQAPSLGYGAATQSVTAVALTYAEVNFRLTGTPPATRTPNSYQTATQELLLVDVLVGANHLEARLHLDPQGLVLLTAAAATHSLSQPCRYDAATGMVTIPYVELAGTTQAYAATLRLVDPQTWRFAIASLEPTAYLASGY